MFQKLVLDCVKTIQAGGLKNFVRVLGSTARDRAFDRKYGVYTSCMEKPRFSEKDLNAQESVTLHAATRAAPFLKMWKAFGLIPRGRFVDFGSGRGRALMLANSLGFEELRGLELDENLIGICHKNLSKFKLEKKYDILKMDFNKYIPEASDQVFYFYDPCEYGFLKKTAENIIEKCPKDGVERHVIYHNNLYEQTPFDSLEGYERLNKIHIEGNQFFLYRITDGLE